MLSAAGQLTGMAVHVLNTGEPRPAMLLLLLAIKDAYQDSSILNQSGHCSLSTAKKHRLHNAFVQLTVFGLLLFQYHLRHLMQWPFLSSASLNLCLCPLAVYLCAHFSVPSLTLISKLATIGSIDADEVIMLFLAGYSPADARPPAPGQVPAVHQLK